MKLHRCICDSQPPYRGGILKLWKVITATVRATTTWTMKSWESKWPAISCNAILLLTQSYIHIAVCRRDSRKLVSIQSDANSLLPKKRQLKTFWLGPTVIYLHVQNKTKIISRVNIIQTSVLNNWLMINLMHVHSICCKERMLHGFLFDHQSRGGVEILQAHNPDTAAWGCALHEESGGSKLLQFRAVPGSNN